ncbi:MAG: LLM class flavin-dependent oxidoreductase, partial [Asticcacaulis sp.]
MTQKRQFKLGLFLQAVGHHAAAWRLPHIDPNHIFSLEYYIDLAKKAEAAKFDAIFFADGLALVAPSGEAYAYAPPVYYFEPLTLLAAISTHTSKIGLISTVSSTYLPPYQLARKFASLDHISKGRTGWNLVTSGTDVEAANFGLDHQLAHSERYARAREYVDVVRKLWDSWGDTPLDFDKQAARFFDPAQVAAIYHEGEYYKVRGPLQSGRPIQGHPVIVQAGSSEDGRALASETAEIVFTAQQHIDAATHFTQSLKALAESKGREPGSLLVLPGVSIYVGETREEAQAKFDALHAFVDPQQALVGIKTFLEWDLSGHDLDGPVPAPPYTEGWQSRQKLAYDIAVRDNLSIRQLIGRLAGARGHWVLVGTPVEVVDQLEAWFDAGAADGFNILPPTFPDGLDDFISLVLPEIRRRGLFR